MKFQRILLAALWISHFLMISACASRPSIVVDTKPVFIPQVEIVSVPEGLTQQVPIPQIMFPISTNGLREVYLRTLNALNVSYIQLDEIGKLK